MDNMLKYERRFVKFHSWFLIIAFIFLLLNTELMQIYLYPAFYMYMIIGFLLHSVDVYCIYVKKITRPIYYIVIKSMELFLVTIFIYGNNSTSNILASLIYILIVIEMTVLMENINRFRHHIFYTLPFLVTSIIQLKLHFFTNAHYLFFVLLFPFLTAWISYITSWNVKELRLRSQNNKRLLQQMQEKNKELLKTKDSLQNANSELQDLNEKYRKNVAEFYILKEVGNYIGSILDIDQLLEMVTDMIMGIMGVDTCSIILFDSQTGEMFFQINSIYSQDIIEEFKIHAKENSLLPLMEDKEAYVDNHVPHSSQCYRFLEGREVGSFISVPLLKNDKVYGLILVEHKMEAYFSEDSVEFFKAISTSIAVAIENATLYEKMEDLATKDGLTNVYNRAYLQKIFPNIIERAMKNKLPLAVAIFDIDYFKKFNDTYGHLFGDKVIKIVANLSEQKIIEYNGIISRYGGEEFLLILPGTPLDQAKNLVEELRKEIASYPLKEGDFETNVQASFGVSSYPEICSDPKDLIKSADDAMYISKRNGRNRVTVAQK